MPAWLTDQTSLYSTKGTHYRIYTNLEAHAARCLGASGNLFAVGRRTPRYIHCWQFQSPVNDWDPASTAVAGTRWVVPGCSGKWFIPSAPAKVTLYSNHTVPISPVHLGDKVRILLESPTSGHPRPLLSWDHTNTVEYSDWMGPGLKRLGGFHLHFSSYEVSPGSWDAGAGEMSAGRLSVIENPRARLAST